MFLNANIRHIVGCYPSSRATTATIRWLSKSAAELGSDATAVVDDGTTTTASSNQGDVPTISARKAFKSIPVDPTILKYIDMIGVGRVNLAHLKAKRKFQRRRIDDEADNDEEVMNMEQEKGFFAQRQDFRRERRRDTDKWKVPTKFWLPPPPFGATFLAEGKFEKVPRNSKKQWTLMLILFYNLTAFIEENNYQSGRRIKRLPVKVLGSAA